MDFQLGFYSSGVPPGDSLDAVGTAKVYIQLFCSLKVWNKALAFI